MDHYGEVTTSEGAELPLMRLSDAIIEAAPVAGLQIHRSHRGTPDPVRAVTCAGGPRAR